MSETVIIICVTTIIGSCLMLCGGYYFWTSIRSCWDDRAKNTTKTAVRSNHATSVRGNLVKTYRTDINEDYFVDCDQELGKGGCGVVVVGEHKETHTQYAIKIVDKSHAERGRLDRELKLLKDVDHTNVVRLFSVYDVPTHMYFVMELCLGGHLGNLLARQPKKYLDEVWGKQLALQLLSAVAHIHSRGIAHRDIKLQNILVDQNNDRAAQLKLIDFGYGSRYVGALPMRTKCGTPYTTAPEVIREHYDERCDVWSCGVVLYIMLCGRRPFEALNCTGALADAGKAAMITNILAGRYHFNHKPWQTVSRQGLNFVKALLHPDYKQRMHSHEALENPWLIDTNIINVHASVLSSEKSFRAVNNIRRMSEVTELQRTGMVALVFGINAKVAAEMSTVFQSFDTDASGMLTLHEFTTAMQKIAPELTVADLARLFSIIDYDKNNLISYTEFLAATLDPREVDIGELNKAFKLFDEDGNGYISKDEMRKVIRMQCEQALANHTTVVESQKGNSSVSPRGVNGIPYSDTLSAEVDAKVERIFAEADVNNDGAISHAEFLWVMTGLDFHLLEKLGVPVEGGYSAKETFLYNSKLNNSYDSAVEDWNRDIDQHFDEEMGFSPKSGNNSVMMSSYSLSPIKGSSSGSMNAGTSVKGQLSFQNLGKNQGASSNSPLGGVGSRGASANGFDSAKEGGSAKNRRLVVTRPIVSPPPSSRKESAFPLDTHLEQPGGEPHSSSGNGTSEEVLPDRPVQRQSRRQRDGQLVERLDTPPSYKGMLAKNAVDNDFHEEPQASPARINPTSNNTLAFYEEQEHIGVLRVASDDDIEMGALPYSPVRHTGSAQQSSKFQQDNKDKDKEKVAPLWGMGASSSALNAAAIGSLSRASSAKFAMSNAGSSNTSQKITSTKGAVSTSLFKNEDDGGEEKDDIPSSSRSIKDLRSMFSSSRQPSYRETAVLDSGSGKEALRVMINKQSSATIMQDIPSASSTRQNSGDVARISAVEPSDPVPPFLSRAGSRVFSLSNMLRTNNDASVHSTAGDLPVVVAGSGKNYSPVQTDSGVVGFISSPGGYGQLSRGTSRKGVQFC